MEYKKRITAAKVATPAIVIIGGKQIVHWIGSHIGFDLTDEMSFNITTGLYGLGVGFVNWIKNRTRR